VCQRAALVLWRGGNAAERLALGSEAIDCAVRAGATELLQTSLELRMSAAMEAGRVDVMLDDVEQLTALLQERPTASHGIVLACLIVSWLAAQGRFAEAQARFDQAGGLAAESELPWAGLGIGTARICLAVWRGDLDEPDAVLTQLLELARSALPAVTLLVSLRTGDLVTTRAFLDGAAGSLETDDFTRLFHHALAAEAAFVTGNAGLAATTYAALAGNAGSVASAGTGLALGPVDAFLALAAAATGDVERASEHADDALRLMRAWGLAACETWLKRHRESGGW
jgi:tetratricopeptide (TPR) repeat protein